MKLKFFKQCLGLLLALFFLNIGTTAQVLNADNLRNVNVDALTDQEILNYYQQAKASGLDEKQLLMMATQRGMPAEQVQKLNDRLLILIGGSIRNGSNPVAQKPEESGKKSPDTDSIPEVKIARDSTIFGSELFYKASSVFQPPLHIAAPAGYVLGPSDELLLQVFGLSEQTYNLQVDKNGMVYIQNVGPILVAGLTIENATSLIRSRLASTIYRAINSGQTRISVTLGKIRSITVLVLGQASKPGTYTVNSLTSLFNLLFLCGGPSDMGSYRNLELRRGNEVYKKIDLYNFLLRGDRKDNVLLKDEDVLYIPYYTTRVAMEGQVKRPGKFELQPGESLDQLLTYCGGFTDSAYRSQIVVTRLGDAGRSLATLQASDYAGFRPQSADVFSVGKVNNRFLNRVSVQGAVLRPGDYELKQGMTVKELLDAAGGLRPDAYLQAAQVARLKEDLSPSSLTFNVQEAVAGKVQIPLKKEDLVLINSIFELKDSQTIEIQGEVRRPGIYQYRDKISLNDLLLQAQGFTDKANKAIIEISRRVIAPDVTKNGYRQVEVIKTSLENGIGAEQGNIELKPFDLVLIRPNPGYESQRSVYVQGEVLNVGRFVLENNRERLSSMLLRAGGFRGGADSSSVTIKRVSSNGLNNEERQRIVERLLSINRDSIVANPKLRETYLRSLDLLSVNMDKIRENPQGPEDIILEDGDIIEVARASSLVRVSGEVFHPTLLPYEENAKANFYIKRSGNYTANARRSRTFVIYPDGRAQSVGKFLMFRKYPRVTPRAEVFVPGKASEGKKPLTTGEWIAISSIIATLATMAVTIINVLK